MKDYLMLATLVFIIGIITVWGYKGRTLSWVPEMAVIAIFWPIVILVGILKKLKKELAK